MNTELTLAKPDDMHLHLRDGPALATTVPHTAERFARAIAMPNLQPPVISTTMATEYRQHIMQHVPAGLDFEPLMTLYLTDNTPVDEIARAADSPHVHAAKLYPAGATTNSAAGVTSLKHIHAVLDAMQQHDLPLLVHGEVTDDDIDIFDRENVFIERHLQDLSRDFPSLRIVFEHVTSKEAVDFVNAARPGIAATITAHHLLLNRNDLLAGGIRPHHYCLPVLKRETHRQALLAAATSGSSRFFLGTDSAPHRQSGKQSSCGCAGIYTSHAAIELYAMIFEQCGALDKLEAFASHYGADFYRLPRNQSTLTLTRQSWTIPESYSFNDEQLVPLMEGAEIAWKIAG